ncbi:MAG TPA: hypothetical protein VNI84_18245 [Pyrinomonadaceae bacterium]|nr:hypothetical protein [Pyrinomonadaceae bacterium]
MLLPTINIEHATDGTSEMGNRLGRLPALDFRDRQFLLSPPEATEIDRMSRHWITAKALDQGNFPHCVAYSGEQFLLSSPVKNLAYKTPRELYDECQAIDEWKDVPHDGTSVRALFKVLRAKGYIESWQNAFDVDVMIRQVMMVSPVVVGLNWYQGMFRTSRFTSFHNKKVDNAHFIHVAGRVAGGHAVMVKGLNLERPCPDGSIGAFRLINSWGSWGDVGKCWISIPDMSRLISEWGEIATSKEIRFRPVG